MSIIRNIQFQQLLNLILLVFISYSNNFLNISILNLLLIIFFALFFEYIINLYLDNKRYIPYSAAITAIGIVLMIAWTKWYIPYILIILAISQKKFLKIKNKHIFNPSNFAVVFALLIFFPKAMPLVGQLGKDLYIIYIIILVGILILIRVNRWLISLIFTLTYIILNYLFFNKIDPNWEFTEFLLKFYSTSFIVYIFFMLTDPITTPKEYKYQIIFGFLVALITTLLNFFTGIHIKNIFISLFFISAFCAICNLKIEAKKEYIKYLIILIISIIISLFIILKPSKYFIMN